MKELPSKTTPRLKRLLISGCKTPKTPPTGDSTVCTEW